MAGSSNSRWRRARLAGQADRPRHEDPAELSACSAAAAGLVLLFVCLVTYSWRTMTEATGADEPRLALAERADLVPGWPQWTAPALRLSRGLDPLGLQTITQDRIMPLL